MIASGFFVPEHADTSRIASAAAPPAVHRHARPVILIVSGLISVRGGAQTPDCRRRVVRTVNRGPGDQNFRPGRNEGACVAGVDASVDLHNQPDPRFGSRLAKRRVCATRAEWAERRLQDRQDAEKIQRSITGSTCSGVKTNGSSVC